MNADDVTIPGWMPGDNVRAAEQAVLGAAISSRPGADEAVDRLRGEEFALPAHQVIFETVAALMDDGSPITPTAIMDALARAGTLAQVGAGPYLATLVERACVPLQVGWFADIITRDWQRRTALEAAARLTQLATNPNFDASEDLDLARADLDAIAERSMRGDAVYARDAIDGFIDRLERPETDPGLPTGILDLDRMLSGLRAGQTVVIAARPSVGKSLLGLGIAAHVALDLGHPAYLASMEMSQDEVMGRLVSSRGRVLMDRLHPKNVQALTDADWVAIGKARAMVKDSALVIDDSPSIGLAHIRASLRDMARSGPARIAVVDYIGLMEGAGRSENRQNEMAAYSRGLKKLAKEFGIPIIIVAQLNREVMARPDKRPRSDDLKDSGAIEADADVVILIHREDMYDKESPRAGEADLIVDKNRGGPRGTVTVAFQGHYARFVDMADERAEARLRSVDREAS